MIKEKRIKVILETLDEFRVGGIADPLSGADNPVSKIGSRLVIPGPSLKGALRNSIETFLIDGYFDLKSQKWSLEKKTWQPCIPATELSTDETSLVRQGKYRGFGCVYGKNNLPICPACYLLGAQSMNGFVRVPFLSTDVPLSKLYSARIDRATKIVAKRSNRPYELVPKGTKFEGEMTVLLEDTVLNWVLGKSRPLAETATSDAWLNGLTITQPEFIKTYILDRLISINRLGGYKSKGFGTVKISVQEIS